MRNRIFKYIATVTISMLTAIFLLASVVYCNVKNFDIGQYFSKCYLIIIVYIVLVFLSVVLAQLLAKRATKPLTDLNAESLLDEPIYPELSEFVRTTNDQKLQLKWQQAEIKSKAEQFKTVVTNMKEGLLLLDENENISLINHSAEMVLGDGAVGDSYKKLKYADKIQRLIQKVKSEERAELIVEESNISYQFTLKASKVYGEIKGYALLIFDVSEKEKSEQIRREFTANVSHELKTPLHSISGCAELLSSGLVKPEDTKQFVNQIYLEAKRMIRLVEDIIKLSSLDEGASQMQREEVDLFAVATETVNNLLLEAQTAGIKLELEGESVLVYGIKHLLSGIIFNLCDNAIKYNKENGWVKVKVKSTASGAELSVKDNGIGIPADHHSRIFERFYRVDKSHSKEVGGTGLGLSIVKHAVRLHDADISVKSQLGKGTKFIVNFPLIKK